jgi:predicted XRE-type DNA-binding protein
MRNLVARHSKNKKRLLSYKDGLKRTSTIGHTRFTSRELFEYQTGLSWEDSEKYRLKLHANTQDILYFFYVLEKTQKNIGLIMDYSQGNVWHTLKNAIKQIKWMVQADRLPNKKIKNKTGQIVYDAIRAGFMSQTEIARVYKISQPAVCVWMKKMHMKPPIMRHYQYYQRISTRKRSANTKVKIY